MYREQRSSGGGGVGEAKDSGPGQPGDSGVEAMLDDFEKRDTREKPSRKASGAKRKSTRAKANDRPGRICGFEPPYSEEQVRSWISQSSSTVLFFGLAISFYMATHVDVVLYLVMATSVPVVVGAYMWVFLETHNPADASCWGAVLPDSDRWTKKNYSGEHKAWILGLDHNCAWLNVSIGRSNYLPFYILVMIGAVQFLLQFITSLLILTLYSADAAKAFGSYMVVFDVLLVFSALLSCYIGISYALLGYFHTYLFVRGLSTYDWMVQQRQAHKDAQQAQREREQSRRAARDAGGGAEPPRVYGYSQASDPWLLCIPCLFDNNVVVEQGS